MWQHIFSFFKRQQIKYKKVKQLAIYANEPHADYAVQLAAKNPFLQSLDIQKSYDIVNSPIDYPHNFLNLIKQLISKTKTLEELNFDVASLEDKHIQELAPAIIENKHLKRLNLRANQLTSIGATTVANIISSSSSLETLDISSNPMGEGYNVIFQALQTPGSVEALIISDLWGNRGLNDGHIESLAKIFETNKKLKSLNLGGNQFSDQGIKELCKKLSPNNTLISINLDSIAFGNTGWLAISDWIKATDSLTSLSLGSEISKNRCPVTEKGLLSVLEAFQTNTSIKHLSISYADSDILAIKIANLLKTNKSLEKITLKNCPNAMGQKAVEALTEALRKNTSVYEIREGEHVDIKLCSGNINPKTAHELKRLLARNKLINAIKENPAALSHLLKGVSYQLLDDIFFTTIIKMLPELLLIEYSSLLSHLMEKRLGKMATVKTWLGIQQNYLGTQRVLSLLAQEAQAGDTASQISLGLIYKNGLLQQDISPSEAKDCFSLVTTSSNKSLATRAHFEIGQIHYFYTRNFQSATQHFDKATTHPDQFEREQAYMFRKHSLNALHGSSSLVSPNEEEQQARLTAFRQRQAFLMNTKQFLASMSNTLAVQHLNPSDIKKYKKLELSNHLNLTTQEVEKTVFTLKI